MESETTDEKLPNRINNAENQSESSDRQKLETGLQQQAIAAEPAETIPESGTREQDTGRQEEEKPEVPQIQAMSQKEILYIISEFENNGGFEMNKADKKSFLKTVKDKQEVLEDTREEKEEVLKQFTFFIRLARERKAILQQFLKNVGDGVFPLFEKKYYDLKVELDSCEQRFNPIQWTAVSIKQANDDLRRKDENIQKKIADFIEEYEERELKLMKTENEVMSSYDKLISDYAKNVDGYLRLIRSYPQTLEEKNGSFQDKLKEFPDRTEQLNAEKIKLHECISTIEEEFRNREIVDFQAVNDITYHNNELVYDYRLMFENFEKVLENYKQMLGVN